MLVRPNARQLEPLDNSADPASSAATDCVERTGEIPVSLMLSADCIVEAMSPSTSRNGHAAKRNIIAASRRLHDRADRVDDDLWLIHGDDVTVRVPEILTPSFPEILTH